MEYSMEIVKFNKQYQKPLESFYKNMFSFWLSETEDNDIRNIEERYIKNNGNFWVYLKK